MKTLVAVLLFSFTCILDVQATVADSTHRVGFSVNFNPGNEIKMDKYQRKWMQGTRNYSLGAELHLMSLPQDSNAFAADYGYPTLTLGVKYSLNHGVTMHRKADSDWGMAQEVDYTSRMGNSIAVYGAFARPFFRSQRWEVDYTFNFGIGYTSHKYNPVNAIDNELIGSRWLIFFGAGLHATYRFADQWGIKGGLEYWHLSNGGLNRPNKGANFIGPMVAICYYPYYAEVVHGKLPRYNPPFDKYLYLRFSAGVGGKTLHEDWQRTQFHTPKGHPDYRTDKFKRYACYSFQADVMYRYARRWASGVGLDLFYGTYSDYIKGLDEAAGSTMKHSPWSVGVAAKHEVFYGNISLPISLGFYLFRKMGEDAKEMEKPFYETIGLHYSFPKLGGLRLGINVKAHLTRADYTEVVIGYPVMLYKRR